MIANCVVVYTLLASLFTTALEPNMATLELLEECGEYLPQESVPYCPLLIENFEIKDIETLTKIIWCESRFDNKALSNSYIYQDSGLVQAIPSSWGWVKAKYPNSIPYWDYPDLAYGFAQYNPAYNLKFASHLLYDMNSYTNFNHWNASKGCWEDTDKWLKLMRSEQ